MSIYIKGMRLPKDGVKHLCVYPDGTIFDTMEFQGPLAKAIELPPHGRLGDLDALYKMAVSRTEKSWGCFNEMERVISPRDIRLTPTIIPADQGGEPT